MNGLEDRQALARDIYAASARCSRPARSPASTRHPAALEGPARPRRSVGRRWEAGDGAVHASHAVSPQERAAPPSVTNEPRFAAVPSARIVPMLANEGFYPGSESSMARAQGPRAECAPSASPRRQARSGTGT